MSQILAAQNKEKKMVYKAEKLSKHTTLQVGGPAEYFTEVNNEAELVEAVAFAKEKKIPYFILGGGSNVLVSDEGVGGLVIKNCIKGVSHEIVGGTTVLLKAASGEVFDEVVALAVDSDWWGLENLSHIPGFVGATPVQNVGAYGVEVKDVIHSVKVLNTSTMEFQTLTVSDCQFSYRDSIFKRDAGKSYVVVEVQFRLMLAPTPHVEYRDLIEYFGDKVPTVSEVREAVIAIRSRKFPDWHSVGTAGSFFKNPIVSLEVFTDLKARYADLPSYVLQSGEVKIPLGWVLDKVLHLKSERKGAVGAYEGQALVLVNYGGATAKEIDSFANSVAARVKEKTGIEIEREVTSW